MPIRTPRRTTLPGIAGVAVAVLVLAAACTSEDPEPPASTPSPPAPSTSTPTAEPTQTATPETGFSGTDGRSLYGQACSVCHGQNLEGTNAGPTFLNRIYAPGHHADISFIFAVERGVRAHHWNFGNMAPVEGLTHEQVLAIIAFIREQQRAVGIQ